MTAHSTAAQSPPRPRQSLILSRLTLRRVRWLAAGYCALLLVAYQLPPGVAFFDTLARYCQNVPLALGAGLLFLLATGDDLMPATRRALRWLALAMALFAAGMISYTTSHWLAGTPLGTAIFGDLLYIPGYLALLAGLLSFPTRQHTAYRAWHFALDTAVVLIGAGLATWYLVIAPTTGFELDAVELFIRLVYPALGLAFLLALNALMLRGGAAEAGRGVRTIAWGVLFYVLGDGLYQVLYYGAAAPSHWLERISEFGYTAGFLCWVIGGLQVIGRRRGRRARRAPLEVVRQSKVPLLVTGGVAAMLTAAAFLPWRPESSPLILGLVALTIALVTRLAVAAQQNSRLVRAQARQQSDARVAALVRHASDLFVVTEPDARIRFASPSLQTMLGRNPGSAVGVWIGALVHPDDRLALADAIAAATKPDTARATVTLRLEHLDGSIHECEVVITDLAHEPAVNGLVLVARDLTERRALESRLNQAQKMEAVGRLAGGIAHDFNNVLTTILAETDLLLESPNRATAPQEELRTIRRAGEQAAALTRQLLAFARQQVPAVRRVDLDEVVTQTLRLFGRTATDINVRRDTAPSLPDAWVDPNQVSQALLNLLLNARDAMPHGGTITVSLRTEEINAGVGDWALQPPVGRQLLLEVADTGTGMVAEDLRRVLEPFYTTKASGHGTGLGLPMVMSTVDKHGGGLRLDSIVGRGTTVVLTLPIAIAKQGDERDDIADADDESPIGRERLLLVDDEDAVRDVTRRLLERLGYAVEVAASAEQARRVIAINGTPDLLVTDVIMPGESGPQLADSLRRSCPDLPVLFVSGFAGDELLRQGTLPAGTTLLQKPYTAQELGAQVRAVLEASRTPIGVGTGEIGAGVRS